MRIIANALAVDGRVVIIAQSSSQSGGRKFGHFVNLRVIALPARMTADEYTTVRQEGVEVLVDLGEADARSSGPMSRYGAKLGRAWAAFAEVVGEAVAKHAQASAAFNALLVRIRNLEEYKRHDVPLYPRYIAELQPSLEAARNELAAAEAALAS